jgi:hypothetical protein
VFHDPKSSESFFPYFSSGVEDGFIQHRYLQAMFGYWGRPENNPASDVYAGRMVDMGRAHVWAWDARPWPDFPDRLETWVDGLNYPRGHWINARLALPGLAEVVAEICGRSGAGNVTVSDLDGTVTGFSLGTVETARQSLQPLMLAYGFDSFATDVTIAFVHRGGGVAAQLGLGELVAPADGPTVTSTRNSVADAAGRVAVEFVRSDMDYQPGVAEVVSPQVAEPESARSSVPVVLSEAQAKALAERWLAEGRVARDTVQFALPPARVALAPGDVVSISEDRRAAHYRIDRVDELGPRSVTAVRVEPGLYAEPAYDIPPARFKPAPALTPVHAEFLDLPLLSGSEVPYAPRIAVARSPWAGSVALYSAADDFGYSLSQEIRRPATIGETLDPVRSGIAGAWSQDAFRVRLATGSLQSRSAADILNGANAAALRFGGSGDWEVIQFKTADLIGDGEYRLAGLLRGQAGTDAVTPQTWPTGTDFVLLDAAVVQIAQSPETRGLARHYRVGPATRPYDDPSYVHVVHAFAGVGLRPYRPAHLAATRRADGAIELRWVRRTRLGGDSWESGDVPLSEGRERYRIVVRSEAAELRAYSSSETRQVYSVEDQLTDGVASGLVFEVAQFSDEFGFGPDATVSFED